MSLVSVIINCYNGEKYLQETLDSLKQQSFSDFELIFVDNSSTDNTAQIAKGFDGRLKYYKTEKNIPLGEARNYGLERCQGEYIAFLDSDDLWDENKLKSQLEIFKRDNCLAMVVSNNYVLNMMTNKKDIGISGMKEGIVNYSDFAINYKYGLSSFMIRKSILDSMSFNFDVRLSYAEEFDFFLRLALYGTVYYLPQPLSTYRIHERMHSLKLKETIPMEYDIVSQNLPRVNKDFPQQYPDVLKRLYFLRDYTKTKLFVEKRQYKDGRKTIRPYVTYNKRAAFFYVLSFLPHNVIDSVYKKFFTKKML